MNPLKCLIAIVALLTAVSGRSQPSSHSFGSLNVIRIHTNETGMEVLGSWGAINMIGGISGYLSADKEESRYFHQMNAIWGVVNLGIATGGYLGARKELQKKYTCSEAFKRYRATRRLYLINAGLDGLYIGTGLFLVAHSRNTSNHIEMWRGYGNSIILQGIGLLVFDAAMYASHSSKNNIWQKALQGVCFTGSGVAWHCSL